MLAKNLLSKAFGEEFVNEYKKDIKRAFGWGNSIKERYTDSYVEFGEICLNPNNLATLTYDLLSLSKLKSDYSNIDIFMECIHKSLVKNDIKFFIMDIKPEDEPSNNKVSLVLNDRIGEDLSVLGLDNGFLMIRNCVYSFLLVPNHIVAGLPVELMLCLRVLQALTMSVLAKSYEKRDVVFSYILNDMFNPISKSMHFSYSISGFYEFRPSERYEYYVYALRFWFREFSKTSSKTKDCNIKKMLLDMEAYINYLHKDSKNSVISYIYTVKS